MKIKSLLVLIALCGFGFNSCVDLDLKPKGQLGEAEVFGSETGVKNYFASLYGWLPIEDFLFQARNDAGGSTPDNGGYRPSDPWGCWESPKYLLGTASGEFVGGQYPADGNSYWPYARIRDCNQFINNFQNYKSNYTEARYNELLGECHFFRAFFYSGMVKRYGGVPIITVVQDPTGNPDSLNVHRNTEYECWKFIYEDLKFAIDNMTATPDKYRASRWTALALQSRLMLYAGSIAKYSQYGKFEGEAAYDQGFAGMSPDKANEFFQYSYDAGKELIESGKYKLYNKNPDLAQNFHDMLLDQTSDETIFMKSYIHHDIFDRNAYLIGHNWDALMLPNTSRGPIVQMSNFVGGQAYPSLTVMRRFEGFPSLVAADGTPKRWDNPGDIREGMEPRMRGCMYFPGDNYEGIPFSIQRGIYKTFTWPASAIVNGVASEAPNLNNNRLLSDDINAKFDGTITGGDTLVGPYIIGAHGIKSSSGQENNCLTGAFVRKYIDENRVLGSIVEHSSFQPWIVFRLGETYVNTAEAAYELGLKTEANTYIRAIRERAGCKKLDISTNLADVSQWDYNQTTANCYPIEVGLQFIRDERYRELWGEQHYWWDIRRWRIANRVLENFKPRILALYYVYNENKYIYLDEREKDDRTWNANRNCFYLAIPAGEINKNPNLLPQNPFR